jgi:N-acetylmuramoyl-L-alanine amidase
MAAACCTLCLAAFSPVRPVSAGPGSSILNQPLGEDAPSQPVLRLGATGSAVSNLQTLLNVDRQNRGLAAISVDGSFGPATQSAVLTFQANNGLTEDGVVGAATWAALDSVQASPSQGTTTQATGNGTPSGGSSSPSGTVGINGVLSGDSGGGGSSGTQNPPVSLSAEDIELLASIVESEAGVCSMQGKIAVAAVVLNRIRAGFANGTVLGVISEPGQFSSYGDSSYEGKPSADSITAAQDAAAGQDPSNGATYYYNPYLVTPDWARGMTVTARIGTDASNTQVFLKP